MNRGMLRKDIGGKQNFLLFKAWIRSIQEPEVLVVKSIAANTEDIRNFVSYCISALLPDNYPNLPWEDIF